MKITGLLLAALLGAINVAAASEYKLYVSEGTSGGQDGAIVRGKYEPLADVLAKALGSKVVVYAVRDFARLEEGMKTKSFDLVMARPSDYPARGIRDYGYQLIATAKPDGQCVFLGPKGATPFKSLADVQKLSIGLPDQTSYTTRLCRAELQAAGLDLSKLNIHYHVEQGAIGFAVESGLRGTGGVASYASIATTWEQKGGVMLWRGRMQPYMPLVANGSFKPEQIARMKAALDQLAATPDAPALKLLGFKAFDTKDDDRLKKLLTFIETAK